MNKQKNQLRSIVEQARYNKFCAESKDSLVCNHSHHDINPNGGALSNAKYQSDEAELTTPSSDDINFIVGGKE